MKKKYGVAVAMAVLAAVVASGCGAKKAESAASSAESTAAAALSSAGESAASEAASKGESAASEGEKKLADFKAEDFKAGDDITAQAEAAAQMLAEKHEKLTVADGTYQVNVTLSGGSGRAKIASPTELTVKDGRAIAKIVWSSDKYDYMEVESIRFTPEIQNGHSVFMVPVTELDKPLAMVGDTTAMSTPHAIDYQLTFELQK
jgi:ABC-type fe3+-hydroxamate transport system, periplasmic component